MCPKFQAKINFKIAVNSFEVDKKSDNVQVNVFFSVPLHNETIISIVSFNLMLQVLEITRFRAYSFIMKYTPDVQAEEGTNWLKPLVFSLIGLTQTSLLMVTVFSSL